MDRVELGLKKAKKLFLFVTKHLLKILVVCMLLKVLSQLVVV